MSRNYDCDDNENTVLLEFAEENPVARTVTSSSSHTTLVGNDYSEFNLNTFLSESKELCTLAWPAIVSYLVTFILNNASVLSLGHIGTTQLAAISLASMLCNVTGWCVGMGMASALDTLCSQSHTANPNKHVLGFHLQRSLVIMFILSIPISILWLFTEPLLLLMGQSKDISKLAGLFTFYMIPGLFPYLVADCLKRYMQAQGKMKPSMYMSLLAAPITIYLQWLLVWSNHNIGVIGAPIATVIIEYLIMILSILYISFIDGYQCWGGWNWAEALDIPQLLVFLKMGSHGVLMYCSESWAYEVIAIASGLLGDTELGAQTVIITTSSMFYTPYWGMAIASSTRIGNALGSGNAQHSRVIALSSMLMALCVGIIPCTLLFTMRYQWGSLFTSDEKVIEIVGHVLTVASFFQLFDCFNAVCGGLLEGSGRQKQGGWMNSIAYYLIGLPLALILTFKFNFGLIGLWSGMLVGQLLIAGIVCWLILRTDWDRQVKKARFMCVGELMDGGYMQITSEDDV